MMTTLDNKIFQAVKEKIKYICQKHITEQEVIK